MSIRLFPPGTRKGNRVYYAIISVKGRRKEISTGTRNRYFAREYAEAFEAELWKTHLSGRGPSTTVKEAIENYIAFRDPRPADRKWLEAIADCVGDFPIDQVTQETFDQTAISLYSGCTNATKNRQVYTPLCNQLGK